MKYDTSILIATLAATVVAIPAPYPHLEAASRWVVTGEDDASAQMMAASDKTKRQLDHALGQLDQEAQGALAGLLGGNTGGAAGVQSALAGLLNGNAGGNINSLIGQLVGGTGQTSSAASATATITASSTGSAAASASSGQGSQSWHW